VGQYAESAGSAGEAMKSYVTGKFLPLHLGHELLLLTAAACSHHLTVVIGVDKTDPYPFELRKKWIESLLTSYKYFNFSILEQEELDANAPKDEDGTILSEVYWSKWIEDTKKLLPNEGRDIDTIFSSDLYGERIAKEFGWVWYPVDPKREIIPISATAIRSDFIKNFKFISPYASTDLTKTVAVVGPESTGKSTLAKKLGQKFGCPYVTEYGRTISEVRKNKLSLEDFSVILNGQHAQITALLVQQNVPLIITDTEALVTAHYLDIYLPGVENPFYKVAEDQVFDKYIVLAPNVKWVDDGERVQKEDIERWKMFYSLIEWLNNYKRNYEVITDSDFTVRTAKAIEIVDKMFQ
jgi:NadR type nicotinamide-nucleotide adenylyltransferase